MATMIKKKNPTSMDTAHDAAAARIAVLAALVRSHPELAANAAPGDVIAADQQGLPEASAQTAKRKDTAAAGRRKYRKDVLHIDDLRSATAEQIAGAQKDPNALLSDEAIAARRDELARRQAGTGTLGTPAGAPKPPGATQIGGRPVLVAGAPSAQPGLQPPSALTLRKRKNTLMK